MATVKELRKKASELGIKNYSRMKKAELETAINYVSDCNDMLYNRTTTPADGQGLISVIYGAYLACSLRIITENELDIIEEEMSKVSTIDEMIRNKKLMKLLDKVPKAFQVRHKHTGIKGMLMVFPLELLSETKGIDIIVTDSLSKYGNGNWASTDIEVCAYLKKKSEWVSLNVQFVNALTNYEDPTFLTPIIDYWHEFAMSTLVNDIAKMKFHNIISSFGDTSVDNDLRLATALKTNINLKNERYMLKLANDQYNKFYTDLMTGRMKIPGIYSYMLTDPAYMLNQLFGTKLIELKSGEYWCNGKTCVAGLFRSPMIAPFEAQKVQLVSHKFYDLFYRDITIFNGYDGAWELMSGADFDGDTCACIPNDTGLGSIVVSAIQDSEYVILHEGKSAKEVKYNPETFWADLAKYNSTVARPDRTGIITNHATRGSEMWHHLKNLIYYAKRNDCVGIFFKHPNVLPKDQFGRIINQNPHVEVIDGEKWFVARGLVYANKDTNFKWVEDYPCGKHSFEDIEVLMRRYMLKVDYINPLQGDEIDGAKTGEYAEVIPEVEIPFQSEQMSGRNKLVGKEVSKTAMKNSYISYSPLGIAYKYAEFKYQEFKNAQQAKASDKVAMLKNLLREDEYDKLSMTVTDPTDGAVLTLVDYLKRRKAEYGKKIYAIIKDTNLSPEEQMAKVSAVRDGIDLIQNGEVIHHKGEKEILADIANSLNISDELVASAVYIATYTGKDSTESSHAYAWILFDEVLAVFARANAQVSLYRVPKDTEVVSIVNGNLYVNDKKFAEVDAIDCDNVPVQNINGKLFALVKKSEEVKVTGKAQLEDIHEISIVGFKYQNQSVTSFKETYHTARKFSILDVEGTPYAFIDGLKFAQVKGFTANELIGHSVVTAPSPNYKENDSSMNGLCVRVIE